MTASARRADDRSTALWAEAPPPSKGCPLADEMGATKTRKRPAKPVLQQDTRRTTVRRLAPRGPATGRHGLHRRTRPPLLPARLYTLLRVRAARKMCPRSHWHIIYIIYINYIYPGEPVAPQEPLALHGDRAWCISDVGSSGQLEARVRAPAAAAGPRQPPPGPGVCPDPAFKSSSSTEDSEADDSRPGCRLRGPGQGEIIAGTRGSGLGPESQNSPRAAPHGHARIRPHGGEAPHPPLLLAVEPLSASGPGRVRTRPGPARPGPANLLQASSARRLWRPARLLLNGPGPSPAGTRARQSRPAGRTGSLGPEGGVRGSAAGGGRGRAEEKKKTYCLQPHQRHQHG
jgi:hypothetical protein